MKSSGTKKEFIVRRKKRAKLLFGLKVLAICGAAVFMIKGVGEIYADTGNDAGKEEETEEIQITEESMIAEPETATILETEENVVTERQSVGVAGECQSNIPRMDWDADDRKMLMKIAMAEAEGESVEGKALVMLVVLNRVWSDDFPGTIEEVIFQPKQFSPVTEGGRYYTTEPNEECYEALELVLSGWDESQGALYFESAGKSDWHRKNLEFLFQYGNHYFYTDKELTE